jgi:hypothetical protein
MGKRQLGFKKHWLTKGEPLYKLGILAIVFGLRKGYSCVEMHRVFGMPNARIIYQALRLHGEIKLLPRGRQPVFEVPPEFAKTLEDVGLTFLCWCNSHFPVLNPALTAKALFAPRVVGQLESEMAHRAFFRDFHKLYAAMYGDGIADEKLYTSPDDMPEKFDYNVLMDGTSYVATVLNWPKGGDAPSERETDPVGALKKLVAYESTRRSIKKLDLLMDRETEIRYELFNKSA